MIHHRTAREVRRFDIFKLIVTVVLAIILLLGYIFGWFQPAVPADTVADTSPSTGTDAGDVADTPTAEAADVVTETPTPTAESDDVAGEEEEEDDATENEPESGNDNATEDVDLPQINAPTLASLSAGDVLPPGEVTLSGSGTPDTDLEILLNGTVDGTTSVGSDGTWSYTTNIDEPGEYELSLNALDAEGNVAASSDPVAFTVEAPQSEIAAPTVDLPDLSQIDPLVDGLPLTGTGTPGSQVEIVLNGDVIDTVTVGEDGTWSTTLPIDEPGDYELSLNALDAEGNVAASSDPVSFTVEAPVEETEDVTEVVCEEEYIVVVDDWLSKLSNKYWGDIFLYPAIMIATNQKQQSDDTFATIDDADLIEPGWKLCIVDADTAARLVEANN